MSRIPSVLRSIGAAMAAGGLVLGLAACGVSAGAPATQSPGRTFPLATAAAPAATLAVATATGAPVTQDGRIAYGVRAADGSSNLFSVLPDGSDLRQLTTGSGNHLCAAYAADKSRIAYCADVSGSFEIWTMLPDGTNPAQLTHLGGRALFPDFSRDGTKVAFAGAEGTDPHTEVYTVDALTGTGLVALTSCAHGAQGCANDYPAWSPDSKLIVYVHQDAADANDQGVNQQVWVMNADGSNQRPLTKGSDPKDQVPDWSPDGSRITYSAGTASNEGIWVMAADGSAPTQLTGCRSGDPSPCAAGADFAPVWSPDGTRIAFLRSFADVGLNDRPIFVMNADGTNQHRLLAGTILQTVPAWQ